MLLTLISARALIYVYFGGEDGSRTRLHGFAGRCITALLPRRRWDRLSRRRLWSASATGRRCFRGDSGAGEESRTLDLNLGKVALYQLSYSRLGARPSSQTTWSGRRVSNSRPQPWQGCALPTELLPRWSLTRGLPHTAPA